MIRQMIKQIARSISEEFSSGDRNRCEDEAKGESSSHKRGDKEERDEEMIKVYDGNLSLRRRIFRVISVPKNCDIDTLLMTALRAHRITRDPKGFYLTDVYNIGDEIRLTDPAPVQSMTRIEGKRPAIFLRFR